MEADVEPKKAYKVFRYASDVSWKSGRRGVVRPLGKPELDVSSPPEFKGEAGIWTPEDMFVASVNVCTLMTFLAFAQHQGLELVAYDSAAEGTLENVEGTYRFTEVTLRPRVVVKSAGEVERARQILDDAHKGCLVSNLITAAVKVFPQFRVG